MTVCVVIGLDALVSGTRVHRLEPSQQVRVRWRADFEAFEDNKIERTYGLRDGWHMTMCV
jgi:hypothetical protein